MALLTNDIDIKKLPIKIETFKVKGVNFYLKEVDILLKKIEENTKKGIAVFTDNTDIKFKKPTLNMDF